MGLKRPRTILKILIEKIHFLAMHYQHQHQQKKTLKNYKKNSMLNTKWRKIYQGLRNFFVSSFPEAFRNNSNNNLNKPSPPRGPHQRPILLLLLLLLLQVCSTLNYYHYYCDYRNLKLFYGEFFSLFFFFLEDYDQKKN